MTDFDPTRPNETASTAEEHRTHTGGEQPRGDFVKDAQSEASAMFKGGMGHPSTKPVLTGAAVGAVAGLLLPFVTLPLGAAAGAGYMFYKRIRSK